jgi:hypothetical protein
MRRGNTHATDHQPVPVAPLQPSRGLELIKSSAKFYANGVGVAQPRIQLSYPLRGASNNPASLRAFSSSNGRSRLHAVTMMCLFLLVLPGLALAAIVWCGARMADTGTPEVVPAEASSLSARLASPIVTTPNDPVRIVSNAQSDVIIHKVKTERVGADALGEWDPR